MHGLTQVLNRGNSLTALRSYQIAWTAWMLFILCRVGDHASVWLFSSLVVDGPRTHAHMIVLPSMDQLCVLSHNTRHPKNKSASPA